MTLLICQVSININALAQSTPPIKPAVSEAVPGEYIIKFKGRKSSAATTTAMGKVSSVASFKASYGSMNMHYLSLKPGASEQEFLTSMKEDPEVEYIEPNYILRKAEIAEDRMTMSMDQAQQEETLTAQSYKSSGFRQNNNTALSMDETWAQATTVNSNLDRPIVAIIDSGLDMTHQVFNASSSAQSLWTNPGEIPGNGMDDDGNGYVDDIHGFDFNANSGNFGDDDGHGTHVAGIVLGASIDIFSPTLEKSRIRIMPLRFLDSQGAGTTAVAIKAIYYAVNNGAQVINNSWGGPSYSMALHEAFTYAYQKGALIVTASGNYGSDNDLTAMYPANLQIPSNISVAATNDWDYLASFSNYGFKMVSIAAPGVSIKSTLPNKSAGFMSGTSMAAPFISGISALALRESEHLTGYQLKQMIIDSGFVSSHLTNKISTSKRVAPLELIRSSQQNALQGSFQPSYVPVYLADERRVVSSENTKKKSTGCGLVEDLSQGGPGHGGPTNNLIFLFGLMCLPVALVLYLRQKTPQGTSQPSGIQRRRFDRFAMESDFKLKVGDKELTAHMKTISAGGVSFSADSLLEKGGILTMQISSPDGSEVVEVQGHVVWSEANKSFGVQFDNTTESLRHSIEGWTKHLTKV
jgi:hypothetical protein